TCFLKNETIAGLVENTLLHFDDQRYQLTAWTIMPNHVHVMVVTKPNWPLKDIVHSWKSYTANKANQILQRSGPFWSPDFFDRFIRDEKHFLTAKKYIIDNPVRAGLCDRPQKWPFSSANREYAGEEFGEDADAGRMPALPVKAVE
ncbi:MAG: transposase, partial [Deltaproteobacteria bacterium]|nr:transposase [Deltaproteobacteria bacterium]